MTGVTLFNQRHRLSLLDGNYQRGRENGLPWLAAVLGRNATAAGWRLDHPRLNRRLLHQDTFLIPERANGVASYLKRLMSIMGHVAGLEGCLVDEVSVALRPIFEKINCVRQREYLPNQAFPFLQIDGAIKVRFHCYLTENVGDQQGWRRSTAPAENVFSQFFRFNTGRVKFSREAQA